MSSFRPRVLSAEERARMGEGSRMVTRNPSHSSRNIQKGVYYLKDNKKEPGTGELEQLELFPDTPTSSGSKTRSRTMSLSSTKLTSSEQMSVITGSSGGAAGSLIHMPSRPEHFGSPEPASEAVRQASVLVNQLRAFCGRLASRTDEVKSVPSPDDVYRILVTQAVGIELYNLIYAFCNASESDEIRRRRTASLLLILSNNYHREANNFGFRLVEGLKCYGLSHDGISLIHSCLGTMKASTFQDWSNKLYVEGVEPHSMNRLRQAIEDDLQLCFLVDDFHHSQRHLRTDGLRKTDLIEVGNILVVVLPVPALKARDVTTKYRREDVYVELGKKKRGKKNTADKPVDVDIEHDILQPLTLDDYSLIEPDILDVIAILSSDQGYCSLFNEALFDEEDEDDDQDLEVDVATAVYRRFLASDLDYGDVCNARTTLRDASGNVIHFCTSKACPKSTKDMFALTDFTFDVILREVLPENIVFFCGRPSCAALLPETVSRPSCSSKSWTRLQKGRFLPVRRR